MKRFTFKENLHPATILFSPTNYGEGFGYRLTSYVFAKFNFKVDYPPPYEGEV